MAYQDESVLRAVETVEQEFKNVLYEPPQQLPPVMLSSPDGSVIVSADLTSPITIEPNGLVVNPTGHIRSGQTTYNTGTGFFLGNVNGTPKFSLGNPSSNYITWDGSALTISGVQQVIKNFTAGQAITIGNAVFVAVSGAGTDTNLTQLSAPNTQATFGTNYVGQTFLVDTDVYQISSVVLKLTKTGNPTGTMSVYIAASTTTALTPLGTVATIDVTTVAASATTYTFTIPTNVIAGQNYFLVVGGAGTDVSNRIEVSSDAGNPYANGTAFTSANAGVTWATAAPTDLYFNFTEKRTLVGNVYTASAFKTATSNSFVGFAFASAISGASAPIVISGSAIGLSGLTVGSFYYLSDTAGAVSTVAGTNTRKVAMALSTTELLVTNLW